MNPLSINPKQLADRATPFAFLTAVNAAIDAARVSKCAKDQRGAAVWHHDYGHLTAASNGPPAPFICDGSEACRGACGKLAVHAEMRAVLDYLRSASEHATRGMQVVHIRVVDGEPVTSGPPSCITCSRDLLEAGVSWIWLWRDTGWAAYPPDVFHGLSLNHDKHRLPVLRADQHTARGVT